MLNAGRCRGSLRPIRERSPRWKGRQARSRLTAPRRLGRRRPLALVCGYRRGIRDGTHKSSRSNLPLCEAMRTRSHERPLLAQPSLFNHCLLRFGLPTSSKSRQAEVSAQSRLRPNNITNASGVSRQPGAGAALHCNCYVFVFRVSVLNDDSDSKLGGVIPAIIERHPLADEDFHEVMVYENLHVDRLVFAEL